MLKVMKGVLGITILGMLAVRKIPRVTSALFGLVAAVGCSSAPDLRTASEALPLQGGSADSADPAVGVVWLSGGGFCTGTLIADDVVLTAAHCIEYALEGFYMGPGTPVTTVGTSPPPGFVRYGIADRIKHPSWTGNSDCPGSAPDVGLIHLSSPVPGVMPMRISPAPPDVGTDLYAVGYGQHDGPPTTYLGKRAGIEQVTGVFGAGLTVKAVDALADRGDSGGPLIYPGLGAPFQGVIVGVDSCTDQAFIDWPNRTDGYARVDNVFDWVQSVISGWHSYCTSDVDCLQLPCQTVHCNCTGDCEHIWDNQCHYTPVADSNDLVTAPGCYVCRSGSATACGDGAITCYDQACIPDVCQTPSCECREGDCDHIWDVSCYYTPIDGC
jgi:hypothetical protein